jgi:hypothetical protein
MEKKIKIEIEKQALALSNMICQHTPEEFAFLFISGRTGRQYVTSPAHAKRIWLRLGEHIKAFEAKNGVIKADLPKKVENTSSNQKKVGF